MLWRVMFQFTAETGQEQLEMDLTTNREMKLSKLAQSVLPRLRLHCLKYIVSG